VERCTGLKPSLLENFAIIAFLSSWLELETDYDKQAVPEILLNIRYLQIYFTDQECIYPPCLSEPTSSLNRLHRITSRSDILQD